MADSVLLELETAPQIAESLEYIHEFVHADARMVSAVEGMRGSTELFENAWRRMVIDVAKGQTAEIQSARTQLLSAFEKRLRLLKETNAVAGFLIEMGTPGVADPHVLEPEIVGMERLKACVFDRWQTADDLEDLAARDYPMTTADLDQIAPQHRPPASWYAEDSKPF